MILNSNSRVMSHSQHLTLVAMEMIKTVQERHRSSKEKNLSQHQTLHQHIIFCTLFCSTEGYNLDLFIITVYTSFQ